MSAPKQGMLLCNDLHLRANVHNDEREGTPVGRYPLYNKHSNYEH